PNASRRPVQGGTALLPSIGIGASVGLLWLPATGTPVLHLAKVPQHEGEVVDVEFPLDGPPAAPTLAGRVADRDGHPLAAKDVTIELYSSSSFDPRIGSIGVRTDATGRFRTP